MQDTLNTVKRFLEATTTYGWPPMHVYNVSDDGKMLGFGFRNVEKKLSASIRLYSADKSPSNTIEALVGTSGEKEYHLHIVFESVQMQFKFTLTYPTVEKLHETIAADVQNIISNLAPIKTLPEILLAAVPAAAPLPSQVN